MHLRLPEELSATQRSTYDLVGRLNARHRETRPGFEDLDARIASYELAYRMQAEALDIGDFSTETSATLSRYGVDDPNEHTAKYAKVPLGPAVGREGRAVHSGL